MPGSQPGVRAGAHRAVADAGALRPRVVPSAHLGRAGPVRVHLQRPAGGQDRLHPREDCRVRRPVAVVRVAGEPAVPPQRAPAIGRREVEDIPLLHTRLPLVRGPSRRAQVQVQRGGRDPAISGMHLFSSGSFQFSSQVKFSSFNIVLKC